jgi:protein-disulfide isomerase
MSGSLLDRRAMLAQASAAALAVVAPTRGLTATLETDDGSPIRNFPAPDRDRLLNLPGLLAVGPSDAAVTIAEFFDYNCGYCRQAAPGLDQMLKNEPMLRLVLIHAPILSTASQRAAEAVAATQSLHGATLAYDLHKRILAAPGRASERTAFEILRAMDVDVAGIEAAMSAATVSEALRAQRQFAAESRYRYTPTFVLADAAFIGWPGVPTMTRFAAAARKCGALQCGDAAAQDRR